jgi:flagellar P-ring protein precursor FlgI
MKRWAWTILGAAAVLTVLASSAGAVRIKSLASILGVRVNQLVGYGLVVGLNGTGDKDTTRFTNQALANMIKRMGITISATQIRVKNVAAVVVTAKLPPFARVGHRIDVTVSTIGDATSVVGGTLIMTELRGIDNRTYAIAQGPLNVGGLAAQGAAGGGVTVNHPTVGYIPRGATIEREVRFDIRSQPVITFELHQANFTNALRITRAINRSLGMSLARAVDAGTVRLMVPPRLRSEMVSLISRLENLDVRADVLPRVVVSARTGTVVIGAGVEISPVAVAHGNLSITITERPQVSQPLPFSRGRTVVVPRSEVKVSEQKARLLLVQGVTIRDLVKALNAIGATPRDLITILQTIKAAGALHAELKII